MYLYLQCYCICIYNAIAHPRSNLPMRWQPAITGAFQTIVFIFLSNRIYICSIIVFVFLSNSICICSVIVFVFIMQLPTYATICQFSDRSPSLVPSRQLYLYFHNNCICILHCYCICICSAILHPGSNLQMQWQVAVNALQRRPPDNISVYSVIVFVFTA